MQVRITARNDDGRGRGKTGRRTALVSGAHPGEEVTVRVDRTTRNTVQGRVGRLLVRSPRRCEHPCRHEFHCTGCPLLAADPDDERRFKTERVLAALETVAAELPGAVRRLVRPTEPFGYRAYAKQVFTRFGGRTVLGSYIAGTHWVTDNRGCPVLVPELARLLDRVADTAERLRLPLSTADTGGHRRGLRYAVARHSLADRKQLLIVVTDPTPEPAAAAPPAGERGDLPAAAAELCRQVAAHHRTLAGAHVVVAGDAGNALLAGELVAVHGDRYLAEEVLGYRHRVGARSFFQVNPTAAAAMFALACDAAGDGDRCVELYAGVGALTLPLSDRFARVVAVERDADAVASLAATARDYERTGIEPRQQPAEDDIGELLAAEQPQVVVLDPPRKGAGDPVMAAVARSSASRVVLIHCEPSALARDLKPLLAGGYHVDWAVPVDPFPRTAHVEAVTLATR